MVFSIFKKDQEKFRNNVSQLLYIVGDDVKELRSMGPPVVNLLWSFAFPEEQMEADGGNVTNAFIHTFCQCLGGVLQQEFPHIIKNAEEETAEQEQNLVLLNPDMIQNGIKNFMSMLHHLDTGESLKVYNELEKFFDTVTIPEVNNLRNFKELLSVSVSLFEDDHINYHQVYAIMKGYLMNTEQLKDYQDLANLIEITLNAIK